MKKHRSKGDRCYNCGGLDHHAKECKLPPQPKKCHFCQSINHVSASCPPKAQQAPSPQGKPAYFPEEEEEIHSSVMLPEAQNWATVGGGYPFVSRKFWGAGINQQSGESRDRVGREQLALPYIWGWSPQHHTHSLLVGGRGEAKKLQSALSKCTWGLWGLTLPACSIWISNPRISSFWKWPG